MSSAGSIPPDADEWDAHWQALGGVVADNPANHYRTRLILRLMGPLKPGEQFLDIGSGQGEFAMFVASMYSDVNVRGLESSRAGVQMATARAEQLGVRARFSQRDLLASRDPDPSELAWADVAVCSEVLEHVDDPRELLRNALPYLKPRCRVVITVPGGPRSAFDRHIGHRQHFDPASLRSVLADAGLRDISIQQAGFPFFNLYRLTVIARSRALIRDLEQAETAGNLSGAARLALRFFERAFQLNRNDSRWGWQLIATAVGPS